MHDRLGDASRKEVHSNKKGQKVKNSDYTNYKKYSAAIR